ncbi:hypothetical protein BpHYR1_053615 [Brachionus plicatilis]|uniref:Uncharacterized protein n=1 Tax=Brachionus plicatilis TaxID=10195 RepID=A0A3M7PH45_BRAPC|nr:hypothetical protein BpHYR1_053615 [Brachionus plicatilis]
MNKVILYIFLAQTVIYFLPTESCVIDRDKNTQNNIAKMPNITIKIVNCRRCVECDQENQTEFPCCSSLIISNPKKIYIPMILLVLLFLIQMVLIIGCTLYICVRDTIKSIRPERANEQTLAVGLSLY